MRDPAAQPPQPELEPMEQGLLLIDDEPIVCESLARVLQGEGYCVHTANGADDAFDVLARHPVQVIVSDQRMPGQLGTELLAEVRERYPDTVRLILSGAADEDDVAGAMESGVIYKYLTKPLPPKLLRANLREAFARAAARQGPEGADEHLDPITGLPTRAAIEADYRRRLPDRPTPAGTACMLMLAVDQHSSVVSSFGRGMARAMLREFASRLQQAFADRFMLCHDAPGVFMLVGFGPDAMTLASDVDPRVGALVGQPVEIEDRSITLTVSVGVAVADGAGGFDELVDQSQAALTACRERGGSTVQLFQPQLVNAFRGQLQFESDLRRAVADEAFHVVYQPQVEIGSGRIVGVEALLRWQHPEYGPVSPADFVPLLERLRLIGQVGDWVLDQALADMAAWQRAGVAPDVVSVNVSAMQLRDAAFPERVAALLVRHGVAAEALVLEVTETSAVDQQSAIASSVEALVGLGVGLAVDDFGTGYSNLSALSSLPFVELKIDRSLVPRAGNQRRSSLFANVVDMAGSLDLKTVAEGVENAEELSAVQAVGCRIVQGYVYSRPMTAAKLSCLLGRPLHPA